MSEKIKNTFMNRMFCSYWIIKRFNIQCDLVAALDENVKVLEGALASARRDYEKMHDLAKASQERCARLLDKAECANPQPL